MTSEYLIKFYPKFDKELINLVKKKMFLIKIEF